MTTYNVFVSVGMASRGRRGPQSIHKRDAQKKNAERASGTANDATHEYTTKGKAKMHNERQLLGTAGHLPGADAVFSSFNRRLENDGIRPRNVASLAEPRSLRTMLRFALVLPLHDEFQSARGRSSEVGNSEDIQVLSQCLEKRRHLIKAGAVGGAQVQKAPQTQLFSITTQCLVVSNICVYIFMPQTLRLTQAISASCASQD
jgi:hypothetical protein